MKSRPPLAHTLCPGATAALCWSVLKACMPSCALSARSSSEMPRLVSREHCHGGMKSCLPSDARIFTATLKPFILRLETFLCSKIRTICFLFSFVVVEPSSYRINKPSKLMAPSQDSLCLGQNIRQQLSHFQHLFQEHWLSLGSLPPLCSGVTDVTSREYEGRQWCRPPALSDSELLCCS